MGAVIMNLKVLLPYQIFSEVRNVKRMVVETAQGSFGILPNRLDGVAALTPGILTYETESGKEEYIAIDQGIMVKAGTNVSVSVRNAIGGMSLGQLHEAVEKEFIHLDKHEKDVRTTLAKLESGFIQQFRKLQRE
jgi:F-type H+-transporting ATPase subunit epsilon